MMTTLSVQRMQLSDNPDDWTWIRWEWARPGARAMPWMHAFGFELWDDPVYHSWVGPQIRMLPSQWRGNRTSIHPGLFPDGPREYWENGVPVSARTEPAVVGRCGAEWWSSVVGPGWEWALPEVTATGGEEQGGIAEQHGSYATIAEGGEEQGGIALQCGELGFGGLGGEEQGGIALQGPGEVHLAAGGEEQGEQADQWGGYAYRAAGGEEQGGEAMCNGGFWLVARGGEGQGGEADQSSGYAYLATGGEGQGGEADQSSGYAYLASGGEEQGGEATQGHPCGDMPVFEGSDFVENTVGGWTIPLPGGLDDTDIVVVIAVASAALAPFAWNSPFLSILIANDGDGLAIWVGYCAVSDLLDTDIVLVGSGAIEYCGAVLRVSGSGNPVAGGANFDHGAIQTAPSVSVPDCASLLFMAVGSGATGSPYTNPGGMTDTLQSPELTPRAVWREEVSPGATGDRSALCDESDIFWIAALFYCPPVD